MIASLAFADNESDRASVLAGAKSDADDGDRRDAEGDVDRFKRANAALRGMKGDQRSTVSLMKICADKDAELVAMARDSEARC